MIVSSEGLDAPPRIKTVGRIK